MKILAVSDGRRGIENQALGLAEAVARISEDPCDVHTHHMAPKGLIRRAPPSLQASLSPLDPALSKADLLIGCGRQAIAPLLQAQRAARRNGRFLFAVFIQDPRLDPSRFDLVIAPQHDGLSGLFVESMIGSPNRVTRDRILTDTLQFSERLATLPLPRAAFLIGGSSKRHTLDPACLQIHLEAAKSCLEQGLSLLVTLSRRTPETVQSAWQIFAQNYKERVWLHHPDSDAPNPYFAFLGGADHLLITEDSTNMLTEGCSAGKSVYRLPMSGKAGKFERLYQELESRCDVERWTGELKTATYAPLQETERMAERLLDRLALTRSNHTH